MNKFGMLPDGVEEDERPWNERHHMSLTRNQSHRLMRRLARARRNGGNMKTLLKRHNKNVKGPKAS